MLGKVMRQNDCQSFAHPGGVVLILRDRLQRTERHHQVEPEIAPHACRREREVRVALPRVEPGHLHPVPEDQLHEIVERAVELQHLPEHHGRGDAVEHERDEQDRAEQPRPRQLHVEDHREPRGQHDLHARAGEIIQAVDDGQHQLAVARQQVREVAQADEPGTHPVDAVEVGEADVDELQHRIDVEQDEAHHRHEQEGDDDGHPLLLGRHRAPRYARRNSRCLRCRHHCPAA